MKLPRSKKDVRSELDEQISNFIELGGTVDKIPRGTSGNDENTNLFRQSTPIQNRETRTPLNDVVRELDERKANKRKTAIRRPRKPQRKLIVDDFGDPLRWVWEDVPEK
ncbi:MAG: hypothetical protein ACI93R_002200 [Flavobacteriales bacterium]|jgi:hypothetical protein